MNDFNKGRGFITAMQKVILALQVPLIQSCIFNVDNCKTRIYNMVNAFDTYK